jgi:hypothetical protein
MTTRKPLKATDRRRQTRKAAKVAQPDENDDSASPLADLFNDRSKPNGKAKRAIK